MNDVTGFVVSNLIELDVCVAQVLFHAASITVGVMLQVDVADSVLIVHQVPETEANPANASAYCHVDICVPLYRFAVYVVFCTIYGSVKSTCAPFEVTPAVLQLPR